MTDLGLEGGVITEPGAINEENEESEKNDHKTRQGEIKSSAMKQRKRDNFYMIKFYIVTQVTHPLSSSNLNQSPIVSSTPNPSISSGPSRNLFHSE